MPAESVHCCVTSPPYWNLRDYNAEGQLGLEATPEEYVAAMVAVFREVRRVLRPDGQLWLNLGDGYATGGKGGGGSFMAERGDAAWQSRSAVNGWRSAPPGLKHKDLVGIPWAVAFALRAGFAECSACGTERRADLWPAHNGHKVCIDCLLVGQTDSKIVMTEPGWYLRSDIIWEKPNPMPESVTDRPTKAHEYLFLLTKSPTYFYDADAIREEGAGRTDLGKMTSPARLNQGGEWRNTEKADDGRNKRSVWTVATSPFPEAHFATYPPALIEPCILAGTSVRNCPTCAAPWKRQVQLEGQKPGRDRDHGGRKDGRARPAQWENGQNPTTRTTTGWAPTCSCPENDGSAKALVLDPFLGSGTTAQVAIENGRAAVGCELNPQYVEICKKRLRRAQPGFAI